MSKASEWAARERARRLALEEAQERIERELNAPSPDAVPVFRHRGNVLAEVCPGVEAEALLIRVHFDGRAWLDVKEARAFARWILDTFGDEP